jgi:hypothetical protein
MALVGGFAALSFLIASPANGQGIGLTGTVTNKANGQKLQDVTVRLVKAGLSDSTDSLGAFRIGDATDIIAGGRPDARAPALTFHGNRLIVRSGPIAALRLSLFDLGGRHLAELHSGPALSGSVQVTLPASLPAEDVMLLRLDADGRRLAFKLLPGPGYGAVPLAAPAASGAMAKRSAAVDTLRIRRTGYKLLDIPLETYTGVRDAALEPEAFGCAAGAICWDFEEGRLPDGWTAYRNEFNGSILVDNTKPRKGAFALHAKDLMGGKEGSQGGPKKSIKYSLPADFGPVLWGRAFVYTTPARPASHAGLFNARYPRPNSTSTAVNTLDWYELATWQQTYMAIWHPPEPPGFPEWVLHSDKPLVLDAWACLEWEFDGANGTAPEAADPRVWVDGLELSWPKKFVFSDPAGAPRPKQEKAKNFTFLEAGVYFYQGLPVTTNWWIDDLAVGPRRIGCD